ncbi:MAG: CotH kinase family protein, partial [Gammaproteobacteria bacterium]
MCIFLANSLYFKDLNNQILEKLNTLIFDNKDNAVSNFGDLVTFFSGAVRGTFSFTTLPELNLVINHQDIAKIYSDKKNKQRNYVPANLEINSLVKPITLKAKVRAKGDRELHWEDITSMSFRVNLKGIDRFEGLEEFSIQRPIIRNYIWEYLTAEIFNENKLLTLKTIPIKFYVNGDYRGVYSLEEVPSKVTIESQKRKNGPIFGLDEEVGSTIDSVLDPYDVREWQATDILAYSSSVLYGEFSNALEDEKFSEVNFDMDEFAKYFALSDLFRSYHGTVPKSLKFYFNPVIGKFQPLLFDAHVGVGKFSNFLLLDFKTKERPNCDWICVHKNFYQGFLNNPL